MRDGRLMRRKDQHARFPLVLLLLAAVMLWPCGQIYAQQSTFEATIVDSQTHEPLPFATIYINKVSSTIANAEGGFVITADSADVARISYVGYETRHINCGLLPDVVTLDPIEQKLGEVVVLPYPLKKFIRQVTKETLKQLNKFKKKQSAFFYRQTAFADTMCYELVESFLTGKPAVSLRDLQLTTGRFAGIRPDSTHLYSFYTNFFTFSQVDFASRNEWPDWYGGIIPLFRNYARYYDVDYDLFGDAPDRLIALHFEPKPDVKYPILGATIYVDEQTLHVRKLEGLGRNINIMHTNQWIDTDSVVRAVKIVFQTDFNYVIHMTEEHGFEEVQSVFVNEQHEIDSLSVTTQSILYNLGDRDLHINGQVELNFEDNLHSRIRQQDYDSLFWRRNEIVKRTPIEKRVIELFEDKKLFGVW